MPNESDDLAPLRKKHSELRDVQPDQLSESEAGEVSGGLTLEPCLRTVLPCIRPIEPCIRRFPGHDAPGH